MAEIHWPKNDWWNIVPVEREAKKAVVATRSRRRRIIRRWPTWTQNRAKFYFGGGTLAGIGIVNGHGFGVFEGARGEVYKFQRAFVLLRAEELAGGGAVTQAHLNAAVKAAFPKFGTDGMWGNETRKEMNTFQKVFGLPQSEVPDPWTLAKLASKLASKGIQSDTINFVELMKEIGKDIEAEKPPKEPSKKPPPVTITTSDDQLFEPSVWEKVKNKFTAIGWQKAALIGGAGLVVAGIIAVLVSERKPKTKGM